MALKASDYVGLQSGDMRTINGAMTKRKRPPRSSRSRITQSRAPSAGPRTGKSGPPERGGGGSGRSIWLYGMHAVAAALLYPSRNRHRLLTTRQAIESLADTMAAMGADGAVLDPPAEIVDRGEIDVVSGPDAVHQGIALLVDPLPDVAIEDILADAGTTATLIVLDQATDPRNIGAVLRSARAFGALAVIMQDRNAPTETGTMAKAASGALEHVAVVRVTNLARALWLMKDAGFWCLGLDGTATDSIGAIDPTPKRAVVLGAEGTGLRRLTRETCDQLVRIPIDAAAESLNLSNAAAVALYAVGAKD